jgi:hypothetical protein
MGRFLRQAVHDSAGDEVGDNEARAFRRFLLARFENELLGDGFLRSLDEIRNDRNRAAHPNLIQVDAATTTRAAIQSLLLELLSSYRGDPRLSGAT